MSSTLFCQPHKVRFEKGLFRIIQGGGIAVTVHVTNIITQIDSASDNFGVMIVVTQLEFCM